MGWPAEDEESVRRAMVQLSLCGLGTQEELAKVFGVHVNSVQRYLTDFEREGMGGLLSGRSGPKKRWKLTPEFRGKVLLIVLREGMGKLEAIQQRLAEGWQQQVSVASIQQVLAENGLGELPVRSLGAEAVNQSSNMKLEGDRLRVSMRRFKDREIDYAARHLCEDLNRMEPETLDRYGFAIHCEVQ